MYANSGPFPIFGELGTVFAAHVDVIRPENFGKTTLLDVAHTTE